MMTNCRAIRAYALQDFEVPNPDDLLHAMNLSNDDADDGLADRQAGRLW